MSRNLTDRELREVFLVKSSDPERTEPYEVYFSKKEQHWICNCKGFMFRGKCSHIEHVLNEYGLN